MSSEGDIGAGQELQSFILMASAPSVGFTYPIMKGKINLK